MARAQTGSTQENVRMTEPRQWPKNAEWARVDSISAAYAATECLVAALGSRDQVEVMRQIGLALNQLNTIVVSLNNAKGVSNGKS